MEIYNISLQRFSSKPLSNYLHNMYHQNNAGLNTERTGGKEGERANTRGRLYLTSYIVVRCYKNAYQ